MTALLPARRRAEAFAGEVNALLAGGPATGPEGGEDGRFAGLLEVVSGLVAVPRDVVEPRESFTTDLRTRLMLAADTDLVATDGRLLLPPTDRHGERRRRSRLATAAATAAVVAATAGVAVASSHSVPGEPLHPVKTGVEEVRSALSFGDAAKGRAVLAEANARLDEISRMVDGAGDRSRLPATIDAFTADASRGSDLLFRAYNAHAETASLTSVSDFVHSAMGRLAVLADGETPAWMSPRLADAAQALTDADQEVRYLCVSCDTGARLQAPASLGVASGSTSTLLDPASSGSQVGEVARSGASGTGRTTPGSSIFLPQTNGPVPSSADGNQFPRAATASAGNGQLTDMLLGIIDDGRQAVTSGQSGQTGKKITKTVTNPVTKGGKKNLGKSLDKGLNKTGKDLKDTTGSLVNSLRDPLGLGGGGS